MKPNARLTLTTLTTILLLALCLPGATAVLAAGGQPLLDIPDRIPAVVGASAIVTVNLDSDGEAISGLIFSLDIDPTCLAFNDTDANGDGIPDAAQFVVPLQFTPSISYQPDDTDGEIDVVITDYSPPLATLPNGPVLALRFDVVCEPDVTDNSRISDITFSTYPPVSFGNPAGQGVPGISSPGSVKISRADAATPTPTPSATATGSATSHAHPYPTTTPSRHRDGDANPAHRHCHTDTGIYCGALTRQRRRRHSRCCRRQRRPGRRRDSQLPRSRLQQQRHSRQRRSRRRPRRRRSTATATASPSSSRCTSICQVWRNSETRCAVRARLAPRGMQPAR